MMAARPEEALTVVARLLDADEMSGDAVQGPLLERVRGYAYMQLGEPIEGDYTDEFLARYPDLAGTVHRRSTIDDERFRIEK